MKTYEVEFIGRKLGAIGIFYPIRAQVFAADEAAAIAALYDRFEHVQQPQVKEIESGFHSDGLVESVQNDEPSFNTVRRMVSALRSEIDRQSRYLAKANADWHDDPDAPEHGLFHAPADQQFPRAMRDAAILELVSRHLDVLNENEAALDRRCNAVNA